MKNSITFCFIILCSILNAQYFTLTNEGLKTNNSNDYLVLEFPNKNKEELYKKTLTGINTIFKSGKDVTNLVENESIIIHGIQPGAVDQFTLDYRLNIFFKDGKIKIDLPNFRMYSSQNVPLAIKRTSTLQIGWWIFSKDGQLKNPKAKTELENFFNDLVLKIQKSAETDSNW